MKPLPDWIILAACACLLASAVVPTWDWWQCIGHGGGQACRNASLTARSAWAGAASTLFALEIQKSQRRG